MRVVTMLAVLTTSTLSGCANGGSPANMRPSPIASPKTENAQKIAIRKRDAALQNARQQFELSRADAKQDAREAKERYEDAILDAKLTYAFQMTQNALEEPDLMTSALHFEENEKRFNELCTEARQLIVSRLARQNALLQNRGSDPNRVRMFTLEPVRSFQEFCANFVRAYNNGKAILIEPMSIDLRRTDSFISPYEGVLGISEFEPTHELRFTVAGANGHWIIRQVEERYTAGPMSKDGWQPTLEFRKAAYWVKTAVSVPNP